MKRVLAFLLAVLLCLPLMGCGGGAAQNDNILGKWVMIGEEGYVKFFENGTAEMVDGVTFDFSWKYDAEAGNYRANIGGRRVTFTIETEEGVTYLSGLGYFFREEDLPAARRATGAIRKNQIQRQLEGKNLLPLGEEIALDGVSLRFEEIFLADEKRSVKVRVSVTAELDMSAEELEGLLSIAKYHYFYEDLRSLSSGSAWRVELGLAGLAAGESAQAEFLLCSNRDFAELMEENGRLDGYAVISLGGTEYYVDLGTYTARK